MKRLRLILLFALLLWLPPALALATAPAASTSASAGPLRDFGAPATAEIREMLQEIPAIRVYMVSAPGNGHQSANLRVIQRLRELGYGGRIQVVYANSVGEKLGYLVPGFKAGEEKLQKVITTRLGAVEFVAEKEADQALTERMKLAISGARDYFTEPHHRQKMNTDYFVQLQPKRWTIRGAERAIYVDGQAEPHALKHLFDLGPLTVPAREATLAEQIERARALPKKGEGLAKLLEASDRVDWLPAYSVDFTKDPADVMEKVVMGMQKAAKNRGKFDRPIVMPILSELDDFAAADVRKSMTNLKNSMLKVSDRRLEEKLAKAKPGQVIPVYVGRLPAEVFDSVISRATLPVVLEGKNLTQQAMERGLPFLNVTGSLKDIEPELLAPGSDKKASSLIRSAFQSLDEKIYGNTPERTATSLANYFSESKDGAVAEFFAKLKVDPASVEQDLTGRALLELKDVMAKTRPVVSVAPAPKIEACAPMFRNLTRAPAMNRDNFLRSRPGRPNRREL